MQSAIAKARLLPSQLDQLGTQFRIPVRHRSIPIAAAVQLQQLAGSSLAQPHLLNQRDVLP